MSEKKPVDLLFSGRIEAKETSKCVMCQGDAIEFRNNISRREYEISSLCQKCQDKIFGKD